MRTIKIQDATYEMLLKISKKLKLTPEAVVDKVIENYKR
jgi:hypothetical protein